MISYVMDVYRGNTQAEKNPVPLGVFLVMFPKMLQGPITRYATMAKDMVERHVTTEDFIYGRAAVHHRPREKDDHRKRHQRDRGPPVRHARQ